MKPIFVRLTHPVLMKLKMRGYNILRSTSPLSSENPTWIPDKVDMDKFLDLYSKELLKYTVPMNEINLLVIDDALNNIRNEDLYGECLLSEV